MCQPYSKHTFPFFLRSSHSQPTRAEVPAGRPLPPAQGRGLLRQAVVSIRHSGGRGLARATGLAPPLEEVAQDDGVVEGHEEARVDEQGANGDVGAAVLVSVPPVVGMSAFVGLQRRARETQKSQIYVFPYGRRGGTTATNGTHM